MKLRFVDSNVFFHAFPVPRLELSGKKKTRLRKSIPSTTTLIGSRAKEG